MSSSVSPVPSQHCSCDALLSDRARLELLRAGDAPLVPATGSRVSVVVLALDPHHATGHAVRSAFASHALLEEVLVAGPGADAAARAAREAHGVSDVPLRVLPFRRPGLAPAAPRARRAVRSAQVLRAALPFVSGDWITVSPEADAIPAGAIERWLARARDESLELVWDDDERPLAGRGFAGALWSAPLAAFVPDDQPGWSHEPTDAAWWARLVRAGVRAPGTRAA